MPTGLREQVFDGVRVGKVCAFAEESLPQVAIVGFPLEATVRRQSVVPSAAIVGD